MPSQMASPPPVGMAVAWTLRGPGRSTSPIRGAEPAHQPGRRPADQHARNRRAKDQPDHGFPSSACRRIAALREELLVIGAAVIGEGVLVMLPAMMPVVEGHFGVDAVAEIDAMGEILGRGQHQLGQGQVAGVEVQRPRLGVSGGAGVLLLPGVGLQFDVDQLGGVERRREGEEDLSQSRAHGRLVVVGLVEVEGRAFQGGGSPGLRLSIGLEDVDDLIEDLATGLRASQKTK